VQNPDDHALVRSLGVAEERICLIRGSGVDVQHLVPLPEPQTRVTAAFVGRLLEDKGVRTLVRAHTLLAERGRPMRLLIAGTPDPFNPSSVTPAEIEAWSARPGLALLGHVEDIRDVWAAAHIAVLPSRREGLPKSLLEAAACGRPLIATDVPGCREIARPGVNALLVPTDEPAALADALDALASDAALRRQFGAAGRALVETSFSAERIGEEIVALYRRMLAARS
jgi:glycosyltransferase involved in cell wall biosynthesis